MDLDGPEPAARNTRTSVAGLVAIVALVAIGGCVPAPVSERPIPKKVELLVFGAKWCKVCRDVPPIITRLKTEFPALTVEELDVDQDENFKVLMKYQLEGETGLPYMVILADGEVVMRILGLISYERIAKYVRDAGGR